MFCFVLLLLAAILAIAGFAYRITCFSPKAGREKIPSATGDQYTPYREEMKRIFQQLRDRPCEFVTVTSHDGLTLSGRYYHTADGAPLSIGFHGYRSSYITDFSGGSELILQMGHNLLLIDERAHGKSQGHSIAFGIQERHDVQIWTQWAVDRFGPEVQILLYGVSMGGATVLMASNLPLPQNVKGIIADCPYSSAEAIIRQVGQKAGYPTNILWPFVWLGARLFGGFDLTETTAGEALKAARVPVLIIHGEADNFVPCEMSDLASCNPALITRHTFPGADHGISYLVDTPRYHQIVKEFVKNIL